MKFFKALIITILLFAILVFSIGLYLNSNSDLIKEKIKISLNNSYKCKFSFSDISTSFIKSFPKFSAIVYNPVVYYTPVNNSKKDTLAVFSRLVLELNLPQLLRENHIINSVQVKSGKLIVKTFDDGSNSLKFLKAKNNQNSSLDISVKELLLSDIEINYLNHLKKSHASAIVNKIKIAGNLGSKNTKLHIKGNATVNYLKINNINYFNLKKIYLNSYLTTSNTFIEIIKGDINYAGLSLTTHGKITKETSQKLFDIAIKGTKLNAKSFLAVLPHQLINLKNCRNINGDLNIQCFIKGNYTSRINPDIKLFFEANNASLKITGNYPAEVSNLHFKGFYSNGALHNSSTSYIKINELTARFNDNPIKGKVSLTNFSKPVLNIQSSSTIHLKSISKLFDNTNIKLRKGILTSNINIEIPIITINEFKVSNPNEITLHGDLHFENTHLNIKNNAISNLQGTVKLNSQISISSLIFKLNKNEYKISGTLFNEIPDFFSENNYYSFKGKIYSPHLKADDNRYLGLMHSSKVLEGPALLPRNIRLQVNFNFDTLQYNQFTAFNTSGLITYKPKIITINPIYLETQTGHLSGNWIITQNSFNNFFYKSTSEIHNIDIHGLFKSFENFDQTTITHENISGSLTGKINLSTEFDNDLKLIKEKLKCDASIKINDGILKNYQPIYSLAKFISLEELQDIRFTKLENQIFINDETILIPQMDILSSAFNIKLEGKHQFNDNIEYNLQILLSELLSKKARQKNYKTNEELFSKKGKLKLFLKILGTVDDPRIKYDLKKTLTSVKTNIKEEKKEVQKILKEEFRSNTMEKTHDSDAVFTIEWDEHKLDTPKLNNTKKTNQSKKFNIIWEEFDDTLKDN